MGRPRRRRLRVVLAAVAVLLAGLLLLAWASPETLLRAEFARQRWLAGAGLVQVQAAGHRWSVLESGQPGSGPTVLLVHGFAGSKENWLMLMPELPKDWHVLAVDLPGWGDSERRADADYGPVAQADRLAEFIATLPAPPDLVVGQSMGGQISGLLAARHPDTLRRLALGSAAGATLAESGLPTAVRAGENPFAVSGRGGVPRFRALVLGAPPRGARRFDEAMARQRQGGAD